jgi:capsular polysaccharide export protein
MNNSLIQLQAVKDRRLENARPRLFIDLPFYDHVLLLQGPIGGFFSKLASYFQKKGSVIYKINFNGGDKFFYKHKTNVFDFNDIDSEFEIFIEKILKKHSIKAIFLIGDKRFYHQKAIEVAKRFGVDIWCLEEGYLRPNYFTLEKNGVNNSSNLSSIDPYKIKQVRINYQLDQYKPFIPMCLNAIVYWFFSIIKDFQFPFYKHHKQLNLKKGLFWFLGFLRFLKYEITEYPIRRRLRKEEDKKYFLCILQVHDDFQVTSNSHFDSVEQYLEEVIQCFSKYIKNSNAQDILLIKHHPLDIGEKNYLKLINNLKSLYQLDKQIGYFHNIRHLSNIYKTLKGAVTINSTLGLKLLNNNIPTINLSSSFYNKAGLTHQGSLEDFFNDPGFVDQKIVHNYINYVISESQVNGCLYSKEYNII